MVRSWAWFGLCVGLSSTAFAESSIESIRIDVPSEIPSGGVLPIFGTCWDSSCSNLKSVIVTEAATDARVEGYIEVAPAAPYAGWAYFVPSEPFHSGATYEVTVPGSYPGSYPSSAAIVVVSAAEPAGLDESALRVTAGLTKVREVTDRRCCSTSRCLDVSVVNRVSLSATLSAERPIATQYLFELRLHASGEAAGSADTEFSPLRPSWAGSWPTKTFDGSSDSYCYTVRARPIVGGEPIALTTGCVANDHTDLGREVRSPEEIAAWSASCEATPAPVDAGTLPPSQADAATDGDGEPLGRGEDDTMLEREESGCQLAGSRAGSMAWGSFALLALALARRRRVPVPRRDH